MRLQTGRQVAGLWFSVVLVFLASAWASIALSPNTPVSPPPASYYVGLVGLAVVGIALWLTWAWIRDAGPTSRAGRTLLQRLLTFGTFLWLGSILFPFPWFTHGMRWMKVARTSWSSNP
jgi:hypothetical protein